MTNCVAYDSVHLYMFVGNHIPTTGLDLEVYQLARNLLSATVKRLPSKRIPPKKKHHIHNYF